MKTLHVSKTWTPVGASALFSLFLGLVANVWAAEPAVSQSGPLIKNPTALTYRAPATITAVPQGLTRREAKKLAATAESRQNHLTLAAYYNADADRLDAKGAACEEAAASYGRGPVIKNLMAPNTAARYEGFAKGFRAEAKADRKLAAYHEQMATAVATL